MSNETRHEALGPVLQKCARSMPPQLPRLSSFIKDRAEDFLRLDTAVFGINSQGVARKLLR